MEEEKKQYEIESLIMIDYKDHVRLRPHMYFQDCFEKNNLNSIVIGALCHAIDEYLDYHCDTIFIKVKENFFEISYNAGMSLELVNDITKAECIMTKIGACSNEKNYLEVGAEFCRIGMASINAAAKKCELSTVWKNQKGNFIFDHADIISRNISSIEDPGEFTIIKYEMDKEIFGDLSFEMNDLQLELNKLKEKLPNLKTELYKL